MFLWPKKKGLITDKFLCELFFIVPIIDHCILKEVGGGGVGCYVSAMPIFLYVFMAKEEWFNKRYVPSI